MARTYSFVIIVGAIVLGLIGTLGGSESSSTSLSSPRIESGSSWTGIDTTQFRVAEGRVSWGQTFVDLVQEYGVDYQSALQVARGSRSVFDVRDVRAESPYRVYVNPWLQEAQYLVYQRTPAEHVVFDLQNPEKSRTARRPVERHWARVEARIDASLYETLAERDVDPRLILRLSEVFAWQIDFFRLRAGDSLRVVYEQRYVAGEKVSPGAVRAAYFKHRGTPYYAFRFDDGMGPAYFTKEGQSMRRKLLKAPLRYTRISSGYTNSRYHPILKKRLPHRGTDYAAPRGTPVRAVGDGVVQQATYKGANGNYVKIRHNGTFTSGYLHLSGFADGIRPGASVSQGETIGYVGSTGRSTGPHLDYRLWRRGQAVDPYALDLPPSRPVRPQKRKAFQRHVDVMLRRLHEDRPVVATRSMGGAGPRRPSPLPSNAPGR